MRTYSFTDSTDHTVTYVDRKRWWWSLSLINPMLPLIGVFGFLATGQTFWLAVPLTLMFVVAPLLDWLFGEDQNNPPESLVPQLEEDRYYRVLTYLTVPLHYITFITVAVFCRHPDAALVGVSNVNGSDWLRGWLCHQYRPRTGA